MGDIVALDDPVREMYDALDEDGSGEIDMDEFKEGCKRLRINFPEVRTGPLGPRKNCTEWLLLSGAGHPEVWTPGPATRMGF